MSCASSVLTRDTTTPEHDLSNHFDCLKEERRWDRQAQRLSGREIDDELKLHRLLDRQVAGLRSLQNFVHVYGQTPLGTASLSVSRRFSMSSNASAAFENRRHPLATTDTHGLEPIAGITPLHFVQQGGEEARPRCRNRMAERDARTIHIQLVPIF